MPHYCRRAGYGDGVSAKIWNADGPSLVVLGDNLSVLTELPDQSVTLVYIDPPFNTGRRQSRQTLRTTRSENGDRVGSFPADSPPDWLDPFGGTLSEVHGLILEAVR